MNIWTALYMMAGCHISGLMAARNTKKMDGRDYPFILAQVALMTIAWPLVLWLEDGEKENPESQAKEATCDSGE